MQPKYSKALSRDDLSQWLIHLSHGSWENGMWIDPKAVMMNIVRERRIRASQREEIRRYEPLGAACLYDVPPPGWPKLIETNPNRRRGYGLIVYKRAFWHLGGRPAIYDHNPGRPDWPVDQRFRLIWTNLTRQPEPVDWTHEREWRFRRDLNLNVVLGAEYGCWWMPCVERDAECAEAFAALPVHTVYSMETGRALPRT